MFLRKALVVLAAVGFIAGCSSTPEVVIDEAQGQLEDRRAGGGLFDHPSRRSDVEFMGVDQERGLGGEQIDGEGLIGGLLDDEMMGNFFPIVYFGYDQSSIDESSMQTLRYYADQMLKNPRVVVNLEGHTDERGSPSYNLALGERRSQAVAEVLMLYGVAKERMTLISFGEEQPAVMGHDEEAWSKNRRVELRFQ